MLKTFSYLQPLCQFSKGSGFLLPCQKWSSGFVAFSWYDPVVSLSWGHVFVWWKIIENIGSFLPSALHKSHITLPRSSPLVFLVSSRQILGSLRKVPPISWGVPFSDVQNLPDSRHSSSNFWISFFFFNIYLFIWLHWVLVVAHGI